MKVQFSVTVDLDEEAIAREGARAGYSLERAHEAVTSDLENRLHDSISHRDSVTRVGIEMLDSHGSLAVQH